MNREKRLEWLEGMLSRDMSADTLQSKLAGVRAVLADPELSNAARELFEAMQAAGAEAVTLNEAGHIIGERGQIVLSACEVSSQVCLLVQ